MKKYLIIAALVIIPAIYWLFGQGYFIMHDDLQVMRVWQMGKCFDDGQIPCRWSQDMAYGYGQAMYNFYSAFPYYIGQIIRVLTPLSILGTIKILFAISIVVSGVGMYLLTREFWGRAGGALAAVLYIYAPYHALDVFVRGALAESFALAILPFVWWSFYRLIKKPNYPLLVASALSLAALISTHNISTMIYAPFTLLWVLYWLIRGSSLKGVLSVAASGFLGVGLAAFFFIPALLEQSLINTQYLISEYSDYHAHFVTIKQLFLERKWGFGPSIFGPYDDLSFQVGWPHWWLAAAAGGVALFKLLRKKTRDRAVLVVFLLAFCTLSLLLTHQRSLPIWEKVPLMNFVQFPWRFLGPGIFFLSFATGSLGAVNIRIKKLLFVAVLLLIIALNWKFFIPLGFSSQERDQGKLTGPGYERQAKAAILDYLPKTAKIAPPGPASEVPRVVEGVADTNGYVERSNRFSFETNVYIPGKLEIPIMHFPNWEVLVGTIRCIFALLLDHTIAVRQNIQLS
jgi:hypothetical protein